MSSEAEGLAHRFHMDIFQEGRLATADEIVSSDFAWHGGMSPGDQRGPDGVKMIANVVAGAFPNRQITHHETMAQGDKVLIRWSMTGKHDGDLMGVPPSGKDITVTGFDLFRIDGGKIVEMWQEMDQMGMMQQIGAIPSD